MSIHENNINSNCGVYTNVHVRNSINFVGCCLATKVFFRQIAIYVMGVDDHRVV